MKKSYITPEIKTIIAENTIMAASEFDVSDTPAGNLNDARSRYSTAWDDSDDSDMAWE